MLRAWSKHDVDKRTSYNRTQGPRHSHPQTIICNNKAPGLTSWPRGTDLSPHSIGTASVHGAIGEHRRASLSSSSSSTHSSTGVESACISCSGFERFGDLVETLSLTDSNSSSSATDPESDMFGGRSDVSEIRSGTFNASRDQSRPITAQNSKGNTLTLLNEEVISPTNLVVPSMSQQEMQQRGLLLQFENHPRWGLPVHSDAPDNRPYATALPALNVYTGCQNTSILINKNSPVYSGFSAATTKFSNSQESFTYNQSESYFGPSTNSQTLPSRDFSLPRPPHSSNGNGQFILEPTEHKLITCALCKDTYKWPHILTCLHVYCFPCLASKFNRLDRSITCPECQQKTLLNEDGPCSLKLDLQRARYMRENNVFPFNCTACTRNKEAVLSCVTCFAYLCSDCRDGHITINQFQSHVLAPITKIAKCPGGDYAVFCDKHPSEVVTSYCCVCPDIVCPLCMPGHLHTDYPNAKGCPPMEAVHPIVVERLNNWTEDAQIKSKDLEEIANQTPITLQQMENKKRNYHKQVDEYSDYCTTVIDQNRMTAHDLIEKTFAKMENESLAWTKLVSDISKELQTISDFNKRTVKLGTISETIVLLETMENAYKNAIERYTKVVKNNEGLKVDLKFDPNYKETHTMLNQNFLSISYLLNGVDNKVSVSDDSHVDVSRSRFTECSVSNFERNGSGYQAWSPASSDSMAISTWSCVVDKKKNGTFIQHLGRYRTKTAFTHMFGEVGHGTYAFTEPSGQAFLIDGSYVICDTNNHRILHYSSEHEYIRTIGQPPNALTLAEEQQQRNIGLRNKSFIRHDGYLYFPNRVAICPLTKNIVATERPPSHDIQIFTADGKFVRCFGGNILQHPRGITIDEAGTIIVVECKVMKLVMFNHDGGLVASYSITKDVEFPNDVAARDKKIFISDNRGHCVHVFNYNAEFLYKIGGESITFFPIGVSVNHLNQVVVTDNHNNFNITVFDVTGEVLHLFESVNKLAKCHTVAVHPSKLELLLTTRDCSVYFFSYDPDVPHVLTPSVSSKFGPGVLGSTQTSRRQRVNTSSSVSSF